MTRHPRADDPVPLPRPPRDPDEITAKDRSCRDLEAIYGLDTLDLRITSARIVGHGSRASADIYLNDGSSITFEALGNACRPSSLLSELATSVGATPALKQHDCLRAVSLLRLVAQHEVTFSEDEIARDWGTSYLQSAQILDVDMSNQAERWGAFVALNRRDPAALGCQVLRHTDGTRYVRCGWFRDAIRSQEGNLSSHALAMRMERVGWQRPGTKGRVKATCPNRNDYLQWTFYLVPLGWED
jgi:hypothetical protein